MKVERVAHSGKIDLSGWSLQAIDDAQEALEAAILKAVEEVFQISSEDEGWAFFPIEWDFGSSPGDGVGGPPVVDPGLIYVRLPIGNGEYPTWKFSLREMVDEAIAGSSEPGSGGPIEGDHAVAMGKIANELRRLSDLILARCLPLDSTVIKP